MKINEHRDGGLGHILISDQFNNRVIEVDRKTHKIVWSFGDGSDVAGPHSVVGVNDAERIGSFTLISGTSIPPSSPALPGCSDPTPSGKSVFQQGKINVGGNGFNHLNGPYDAKVNGDFKGQPNGNCHYFVTY